MKQTNNAIKFLVAQYRAIFRNANLKMFLAAATAAAALAAGSAQSAGLANWKDISDGNKYDASADTVQKKLAIVGSDNNNTHATGFEIIVSGTGHTIKGIADHAEFTVTGEKSSITLTGDAAGSSDLTIGAADAAQGADADIATVKIKNLNVNGGTLKINGGSSDDKLTKVEAGAIVIGEASAANPTAGTDAAKAVIALGKNGVIGSATDTTSFNINAGGELKFSGAGSVAASKNGINLNGGKISLGVGAASSGTIVNGLIAESGVLTLGDSKNAGKLTIETGNAHFKGANSFESVSGDSNLTVNGDVTFEKGSIKANSGSVSFGTLDINKSQTLTIDAADWAKFFEGKGVAFTGKDATSVVKIDVKNATAEQPIDLATVVKADDGTFALTGGNKITVTTAGKAKIYADHAKFTAGEKLAASSGSFNFGSFEVVGKSAGDGKPYTFTIDGTDVSVTNQLKAVNPKSVIAVAASTGKSELTLGNANTTSGKLVNIEKVNVSGASAGADKNVLNINGKWDFGGARLNVGGNGTANINAGAEITNVERLQVGANPTEINIMGTANIARLLGGEGSDPAGNINVMTGGHLNIFGDGKAETKNPDNNKYANDVQLTTAKLNINAGGTVALVKKDAWDDVLEVSTDSTTGLSTFTVHADGGNTTDFGGWKKENVALNGGTLRIDLTGYKVKDKAAVDALVGALASEATKGKGLFDFGGLAFDLAKNEDGSVDLKDLPNVKSDATKDLVVNVGTTTTLGGSYSMGSAKVEGQTLTTAKDSTLEFSNAQNGQFATNTTKDAQDKTVNISLDSGSSLILNGNGSLGNITKASSATSTNAVFGGENGQQSVGSVDVDSVSVIAGGSVTTNGAVSTGTLEIGTGAALNAQTNDITVSNANVAAHISGDIDAKSLSLSGGAVIADGANVDVESLVGASGMTISVGQDGDPNGTASVYAGTLDLKSGTLFVDPEYGQHYASVTVGSFTGNGTVHTDDKSAGIVNGSIIVGKNAALGIGFDSKADLEAILADYVDPVTKSFADTSVADATGLANALVLNKQVTFSNATDSIYVGSDGVVTTAASGNSVQMKAGSGLIVTDNVFTVDKSGKKTGAAITLHGGSGTVSASGASVILVGDFSAKDDDLILFSGTTSSITDLTVKSANGLLSGTFSTANKGHLDLNIVEDMKSKVFLDASAPVKQLLLDKAAGELTQGSGLGWDFIGKYASSSTSGAVVDAAAHAATYAGAQQAAVAAVGTMAEAVGGRVGSMGVESTAIAATGSTANGGVWVAPMYKSVDADGFNAEGASYGADVDLAGVAFGTDTVNGNMRFGAVFNIGSGDADGKGNGNGLKDEFDYYGFGIYSVMGFGQLAIVGDASLSVISHEVEGLEAKGEADTTAVTMGVTGQYTISNPMVDVTPHLGARFIRLDTDSYDLKSAEGTLASTDFDVQNVFSIPLGVTLSKAFEMGGWSLAPSADLSITFNTGDTDAKSTTQFTGVKAIDLTTEVLDEVTYGVAVGLGAQYGAFGTQIGLNYTGSENTDAFGVNAQARYMF